MARIVVTEDSDRDLDALLLDLAGKAGVPVAIRYNGLFESLYDRLAAHPAIGASRLALGRDIRVGIVTPYIVIYHYDPSDDVVTILPIVHGRRRINRDLMPG